MLKNKIAFISEHASPLSCLGGVDAGGQNVYVAELAMKLASMGYEIDIFTRRDNPRLPTIINWMNGVRVIHITAGPCSFVVKEEMLPLMKEFKENVLRFIKNSGPCYQLMHANFFMSALTCSQLKKELRIPFVLTFLSAAY